MSRLLRRTALRAEPAAERMPPAGGLVSKPSADEHPPTPVPEPGPPAPEPAPPAPEPEPPTPEPGPPPPQLRAVAPPVPEAEPVRENVQELRQFANADGQLPVGFDPVVRESFGELLYAAV